MFIYSHFERSFQNSTQFAILLALGLLIYPASSGGICHPWIFRTDLWWSRKRSWKRKRRKNEATEFQFFCCPLMAAFDFYESMEIIESRVDFGDFNQLSIQSSNSQTGRSIQKFCLVVWVEIIALKRLEVDNSATLFLGGIDHPSKGRSSLRFCVRSVLLSWLGDRQPTPPPEIRPMYSGYENKPWFFQGGYTLGVGAPGWLAITLRASKMPNSLIMGKFFEWPTNAWSLQLGTVNS